MLVGGTGSPPLVPVFPAEDTAAVTDVGVEVEVEEEVVMLELVTEEVAVAGLSSVVRLLTESEAGLVGLSHWVVLRQWFT